MSTINTKLVWALRHIDHGLTVFPSQPDSKLNLRGSRLQRATADPIRAEHTWKDGKCNIKALIKANQICLDFEKRSGGNETFREIAEAGEFDPTYSEQTAEEGWHVWYLLPEGLEAPYVLTEEQHGLKGMELKGKNNDATVAGSVIAGKSYKGTELALSMAPQWLIDLVKAHQPKPKPEAPAKSEARSRTPEEQLSSDQMWAEAALVNTLAELRNTAPGKRFFALNKASLSMGNLVHILDRIEGNGEGYTEGELKSAVNDWADQAKIVKTIETGIAEGMRNERHAPMNYDEARAEIYDAIAQMEAVLDGIKWGGTIEGTKGNVRALSLREALKAMIRKAKEHNSLNVIASILWLAEEAYIGPHTANKVIKAACDTGLLQYQNKSSRVKAGVYRLTAHGFNALLKLRALETDDEAETPLRVKVKPTEEEKGVASPSVGNTFTRNGVSDEALKIKESIDAFSKLGIFGHFELGRPAKLICERLAEAPATSAELQALTGLAPQTLRNALLKLEDAGFVERGNRSTPHTLKTDGFSQKLMQEAEARRMGAKVEYKASQTYERRKNHREQMADPNFLPAYFEAKAEMEARKARVFRDAWMSGIDEPLGFENDEIIRERLARDEA